MKKLIMMASVACAAAFAHGAAVDWAVQRNTNTFTPSATVYAFLASDSSGVTTALGTLSAFTEADFESALATAGVTYSGGYSKGSANTRGAVSGTLADTGIADDTDTPLMLVVFSQDGKQYTTVDGVSGHAYTASTQDKATTADYSSSFASSSWTPISGGGGGGTIPEPTSGLLLALGACALALRRRR